MPTLRAHAVLDHDADTVWQVVRDAGAIADWFPAIASASVEGTRRRVTFADGSVLEEDIVTNDDALRRFQYRAHAGDLPVENHLGTVDVIDLGPGRSILIYSTEIIPDGLASPFDRAVSQAVAGMGEFLSGR